MTFTDTKLTTIILNDESTWPSSVVDCLNKHHEILYLQEARHIGISKKNFSTNQYDQAHQELYEALLPFHLNGYHCTRLTESEVFGITNDGMKLQNLDSLSSRIDALVACGTINLEIAHELKTRNEANHKYRASMLWFCFFLPRKAGDGIERFFRSWGGEALYNSHEDDPKTGVVLKKIGRPCIVEADIPIEFLNSHSCLTNKISRIFLKSQGLNSNECCDFETYSQKNIPPENIKKVFQFPDPKFIELSGCNNWNKTL
jgi:hypothetical protein